MEKLFTYGMLQNNEVQQKLFGRNLKGTNDILENYELGKLISQGDVFRIANPKLGSEVPGIVYEVSHSELERADRYEDEAYKRIKVTLKSGLDSWVYVNGNS